MTSKSSIRPGATALACVLVLALVATPASAETIWTPWTSGTTSAADLGIAVTYTAEMEFLDGGLNWLPSSSSTGVTADNASLADSTLPEAASLLLLGIGLLGLGAHHRWRMRRR
jgi:hypothetical protein